MPIDNDLPLSSDIKQSATRYAAPDVLRQRIVADIRTPAVASKGTGMLQWLGNLFKPWPPLVAGLACGVLATTLALQVMLPTRQEGMVDQVTSSHVRSLMVDHASDVASSDQHTVKPWFTGKLDYSPPVKDFAPQGFALKGGRIDYINQRPVAALVYQREAHLINLFVWPSTDAQKGFQSSTRQGFNLVQWHRDGMAYWLISDLAAPSLQDFASKVSDDFSVETSAPR
jgi:anti-sigma factor RsiW